MRMLSIMGLGDLLKNVSSGARNMAFEAGAAAWIKRRTRAVREVRHVRVDPQNRTASIELELVGETAPVHVQVGRYELLQRDGEPHIRLFNITSSREWLTILAEELVAGRDIPIPSAVTSML